ncbi:hypothetical protein [Stackebrandtia nassauensis]|uniref:Uncharacterized protein n=1 Tax=Stackebrandtia nassauensis (strain DSM 44728 / CIP 108903 / NRRL B-16338 / NBRC 102104 / LLR-40K-21) TaxID=446470 RepID=D3Q8J0_STANL|nr:hypothetical protein [Stackebrandtia nassauensis]ADD44432.1 hypothetical protein Snas_4791 [Stackebrandtia nassauensis DSM 44728]
MGRLADTLDALSVRALSPDHRIQGQLHHRTKVDISFTSEDSYYEYKSEQAVAAQLSAVLNALIVGRNEGFCAAVREVTDLRLDDRPHWDARRRRFREERDGAPLEGQSAGGWLTVASVGLRDANATVKPGAFDELDASGFLIEVHSAIADLWKDQAMAMSYLRRTHFG